MPTLQFHEAGRPLFVHVLRPGRTLIGRSDSCDLALPSESVSRVHCMLDGRSDSWVVTDRSRHGTRVNGERIEQRILQENDEIGIGVYTAVFSSADEQLRGATTTVPVPAASHEELVEGNDQRVATYRAEVQFVRGPHLGRKVVLSAARTSVGGPGATIELDAKMPRGALYLRVVRGRPMIEPGAVPAYLAGARVRETTPVMPGEEVRTGEHGFIVQVEVSEEPGRELEAFGEMVGRTPVMRRVFGVLQRMAAHDQPVLLTGESGTGKELAARALHLSGPRFEGPFVALNCAAIAESLFESELFGHEKGAFTGADRRQDGAWQRADGGTLFLDEIGEMQLEMQGKLLRALESGEIRRVGGSEPEFPDVRVISATNRNLLDEVRQGRFRQDLYFRLDVLSVRLPSLRERIEDISVIAQTLLARHHPGAQLSPDAIEALERYEWPGNVRELRNVLTRAVVMSGPHIQASDLSFNPWSFGEEGARGRASAPPAVLDDPERELLEAALREAGGNRTAAARLLGIPRSSLLYKLNKHGLLRK